MDGGEGAGAGRFSLQKDYILHAVLKPEIKSGSDSQHRKLLQHTDEFTPVMAQKIEKKG